MLLKKLHFSILTAVLILSCGFSPTLFAGGRGDGTGGNRSNARGGNSDGGGGGPKTVSAGALKLLIEGGGLKRAMLNYVNTIQVNRVEDGAVRTTVTRMMN